MQFSMATAMYKVFSILKCGSAVGKSITEEVVRKSYRVLTSAVFKTPSSSSLVYVT
jgi:hypothetical protein